MTKQEWINIINKRQDYYVEQLSTFILCNSLKKDIGFNSPTGTGKTIMVAKLMNKFNENEYFFLITTLSKGGLNKQVNHVLATLYNKTNFIVYGTNEFTKVTKLQSQEILKKIPCNKKLIWIRDEAHIKTNRWSFILEEKAYKIVNISATNKQVDIQCNFTDTPLLRTPYQMYGSPEDAINKLIQIKKIHSIVPNYNPCLLVRDVNGTLCNEFEKLAKINNLECINITNKNVDIQELCKNDNKFDVIINKLKITEGIDIPRASVIFIGNQPSNDATTIQLIGRVRRNALLWNKNIDIFLPENNSLLNETTKTYVYYNEKNYSIETQNNELIMELSNYISIQQLLIKKIIVSNNTLENGYKISELSLLPAPYTGEINITQHGLFNFIENLPEIYKKTTKTIHAFGFCYSEVIKDRELVEISLDKFKYFRINNHFDWKIDTSISSNVKFGKLFTFINQKYSEEILEFQNAKTENQLFLNNNIEYNGNYTGRQKKCLSIIRKYLIKIKFLPLNFRDFLENSKKNCHDSGFVFTKEKNLFAAITDFYFAEYMYFYGAFANFFTPKLTLNEINSLDENDILMIISQANIAYEKLTPILNSSDSSFRCPYFGSNLILNGMADLVTENFILLFCNSKQNIQDSFYKSLALHYLSTKRNDLNISSIFIYSFSLSTIMKIDIKNSNLTHTKYIIPKNEGPFSFLVPKTIKLQINNLVSFYKKYGKASLILEIQKQQIDFSKLNKKDVTTIFKSISIIGDKEIQHEILIRLKPNRDVFNYALKVKDINIAKKCMDNIILSSIEIDKLIKTKNEEIILHAIELYEMKVGNLLTALEINNWKIIEKILLKLKNTDFNRRIIYNTNNKKLIECYKKMLH